MLYAVSLKCIIILKIWCFQNITADLYIYTEVIICH